MSLAKLNLSTNDCWPEQCGQSLVRFPREKVAHNSVQFVQYVVNQNKPLLCTTFIPFCAENVVHKIGDFY